jgi:hypothetical protein
VLRFVEAMSVAALSLVIGALPTQVNADASAPSAELYVSARYGSDAWTGRLPEPNAERTDGPLASFEGARRAVRGMDKTKLSKVTVLFRNEREGAQAAFADAPDDVKPKLAAFTGVSLPSHLVAPVSFDAPQRAGDGVYRLSKTIVLGPEDSGSQVTEIAYQNFPGEFPVFSGGVRVRNWINLGGNRWQAQLPPETQNFENLFYNGERRLRPRLGGYLGPYRRIWHTISDSSGDESVCPQEDGYECFDRFRYNDKSDPQYHTDLEPEAWGNLVTSPGSQCDPNAPSSPLAGDIEVLVFEQFSTSKLRVSCVDTVKHIVYMTGATAVPIGANAGETGFITGNRYIVENVKNALSEPGQWFLDRSDIKHLTLTYLAQPGEDPNHDEVIIPQVGQLLVAHDVQYLTLRGLVFEHDNFVVPPTGHVSTELEPDITSAISFQNAQHITVQGITVRHTAGGGLDFISCLQQSTSQTKASPAWCQSFPPQPMVGYSTITDSFFYDLGVHGIRIGLNNNAALDNVTTDANVPQHFLVQNNVVSGYGRVIPASFGIGQGVGHDNFYAHNDVYDGYHCAISISHGGLDTSKSAGNSNNTIAFNHVHDLLQGIMNDGGSIRIESGNGTGTAPGNKILNNKIHDTSDASATDPAGLVINGTSIQPGYGGDGIYLDNATGLVDVENNLVYRVSGNAVYTPHGPQQESPTAPWGHGQSNLIKNNILAFARRAMISINDPYYNQSGPPFTAYPVFYFTSNLMYFDRDDKAAAPFYIQSDCTFSANLSFAQFMAFERNLYWRTDGAFDSYDKAFHVQKTAVTSGPCSKQVSDSHFYYFNNPPPNTQDLNWQADVHEDAGSSANVNPHFANPNYPFDDYALPHGSPNAFFVPFDTRAPGRPLPLALLVPPAVKPTFVIAPFDPRKDF